MYDVVAGIKVVEVALYMFVPTAGAVLADWGACRGSNSSISRRGD